MAKKRSLDPVRDPKQQQQQQPKDRRHPSNDFIDSQASRPQSHNASKPFNPRDLFDMVSKDYENWQKAIYKQFHEHDNEDNFSPFPGDESSHTPPPIFNGSLMDALDASTNNDSDDDEEKRQAEEERQKIIRSLPTNGVYNHTNFLNEQEIDFLRDKIAEMVHYQEAHPEFRLYGNKEEGNRQHSEGFTLYGTRDEEGLHSGNTDECCPECGGYDQDDYDIGELEVDDEEASDYEYGHTHHIEVELNTAPECDVHGMEGCDCPIYDYGDDSDEDEDGGGPSCEFTFEYDHTGKLIPTYNNVEEKLRLMNLEARIQAARKNQKRRGLATIEEIHDTIVGGDNDGDNGSSKAKKKKNKKKKKKKKQSGDDDKSESPELADMIPRNDTQHLHQNLPSTIPKDYYGYIPSNDCCLFCEYEAIFGKKPRNMMKWYDQRIYREEKRREEFKKKLENAKLKAIKKQREMRQKQLQEQNKIILENLTNVESPPLTGGAIARMEDLME